MKKNENNSNSKVIYAVLGLSLLGQGTYIYKQAGDTNEIKSQIEESNKERTLILAELTKLNNSRDSILNQNTLITKQLVSEREKVVNMIEELSNSKKEIKKLKNSLFACKELERINALANNVLPNTENNSIAKLDAENKKAKEREDLKIKKEILKRKKDSLDNKIKFDKAKLLADLKRKSDILKAKKDSIDKKIKADNEKLLAELKKNNAELKEKQLAKEKELTTAKQESQEKKNLLEKEKKAIAELAKIKKETADKEKKEIELNIEREKKAAESKRNEILANEAEAKRESEARKIAEAKRESEARKIAEAKRESEARKIAEAKKEATELVVATQNKNTEVTPTKKVEDKNPNETRFVDDEKNKLAKKTENVEKLSKLNIKDLKSIGVKSATDDEEEMETILASDVDVLRISFTLPQNFVVRSSERNYFIQILDSKGNLVGENATVIFEDDSRLAYTFNRKVKYKNKAIDIVENMFYKNFKKGVYTVKVFDKNKLVGDTTFTLR